MTLLNPNPRPYPIGPKSFANELGSDPSAVALIDGDTQWTYGELETAVAGRAAELVDDFVFFTGENSAELVIEFLACQRAHRVWVGLPPKLPESEREALRQRVRGAIDLPTDVGAVAFTSGTTGRPKGVMHSPHSMLGPCVVSIEEDPPVADERIGTPLSLCVLNMLLLGPVSALVRNSTAVIMDRTWSAGFAEDVLRHGVTKAFVVPTMLYDLVHDGSVTSLSPLRSVVVGGAGINMAVIDAFEAKFGVRPIRRWGFTEAPTGVVTDGHPLPHIEVVENDGELCVHPVKSGPWADCFTGTLGYLDDPAATEDLFRGGVLHTGDAGSVDENGVVSVTGRLSEMILRGGANVDPTAVEEAIRAIDGVADAAVVGLEDDRLGQVVGAVICGDLQPEDAASQLAVKLAKHMVPEMWRTTVELPRNAMGKVDRAAVRQLFHDSPSP